MKSLDDLKFNSTRRHFLSATSLGIGGVALGALLDPLTALGCTPQASTAGAQGSPLLSAPHLAPRAKRVIYLFQSGGPSQLDLFDYKPMLRQMNGQELPASVRMGQRLTGMTAFQRVVSAGRLAVRVRAARAVRRLGQRPAAAHRARSSTSSASSARCTPRRSITTRRSRSSRPARSRRAGRRWARGCPTASGPRTRTCRRSSCCFSRARGGDQPLYSWLWGSGFLPSQHQGVQFRERQRPGAVPRRSGRPRPRRAAGACSTAARARGATARARDGPGDQRAHRAVRDGLPHADGRARAMDLKDEPASDRRHVRPRRARARHLRRQLPAGAAAGRARRALHPALSPGLGPARQPAGRHPDDDQVGGSGVGGAGARPQAARPARRHAGDLGRRVRPHQLLAGQARTRPTTAATTIRAASRSGWRAAA